MLTRLEKELEAARSLVSELEAKVQEEADTRADVSPAVMRLAVALHRALCPRSHELVECNWYVIAGDEAEKIDWTLEQPAYWLTIARTGLTKARELGFVIQEPKS